MRPVIWTDDRGRRWTTELPDAAPDSDASIGVPLGPPDIGELDLPPDVEVRLHNQLHDRGILTAADAHRRRDELRAALMAALRIDADRILNHYLEQGVAGEPRRGAAV